MHSNQMVLYRNSCIGPNTQGTYGRRWEHRSKKSIYVPILLWFFPITGFVDTADVHDEDILKSVTGLDVRMTVYNTYPQRAVMANCAKITSRDHYSTNGVIHIVDKVMLPATKTLKEMIENDVQLASLKAVLEKSNLLEKLGEPGQYTLLAPSNEAFASLEPVSGL